MILRKRADLLAYEQGLAESKEKAKALIMAERIAINNNGQLEKINKPGHSYPIDAKLVILPGKNYVSRGAYKLITILDAFKINVSGLVCLDAGASTGGFTDCLLNRGAKLIYAIDVGKNQLHEKLRKDPRVISHEEVNLRTAPFNLIPEKVDFICADLSFISLTLILPTCIQWLKPNGKTALLIKPQFELEPKKVHKGVVRNEEDQLLAVNKIINFCTNDLHMELIGYLPAQIKGPKGNQEYMSLFSYK